MTLNDDWGIVKIRNISTNELTLCSEIVEFMAEKYIKACIQLTHHYNKITIDSLSIITMVLLWEADRAVIDFGNKVLKQHLSHQPVELVLSVKKIHDLFRKYKFEHLSIGESAPIFLTAVIEYTLRKILFAENLKQAIWEQLNGSFKILV